MDRDGVLVLNAGSSSVKYRLFDTATGEPFARGTLERAGDPEAVERVLAAEPALDRTTIVAVGHRVVHGADRFQAPTLIDDRVLSTLRSLVPLAPLHLPANITGIEAARRMFPKAPQVAVFDTAFHHTLPPRAYTYAVPAAWREQFGVRRYGFHGISYQYVSRRAAAFLHRDPAQTNLIVLHLGNGASACAIEAGRSIDTSMGLTPLEGLVMGTRSGDVDPALPDYLHRVAGLDSAAVDDALNRDSGLLALAGSNDLRDVWAAAEAGHEQARQALDVYCYRIRKYIGAYLAALGHIDAVVFAAGVGERDPGVRAAALAGLEQLGITVDARRNEAPGHDSERVISRDGAAVPVLVIPTDEEAEIARQTLALTAVQEGRRPRAEYFEPSAAG
jgi:acetate kinase